MKSEIETFHKDDTVTIRHRDTCAQERINISQVETFLHEKIKKD